jgi:DNA-binding NtrC family response regulator
MPDPVLVVHDDASTRDLAVTALNAAGLRAAGFSDPMAALTMLEVGSAARVLVTRVDFGIGKLNGAALARMLRLKRPDLKVVFLALSINQEYTDGLGEFMSMPVDPHVLVDAVARALTATLEGS